EASGLSMRRMGGRSSFIEASFDNSTSILSKRGTASSLKWNAGIRGRAPSMCDPAELESCRSLTGTREGAAVSSEGQCYAPQIVGTELDAARSRLCLQVIYAKEIEQRMLCHTIQPSSVVIPLRLAAAHRCFAARDSFRLPSCV